MRPPRWAPPPKRPEGRPYDGDRELNGVPQPNPTDMYMLRCGRSFIDRFPSPFTKGTRELLGIVDMRDDIGAAWAGVFGLGGATGADFVRLRETIVAPSRTNPDYRPIVAFWALTRRSIELLERLGFGVPADWGPYIEKMPPVGTIRCVLKRNGAGILTDVDFANVSPMGGAFVSIGDTTPAEPRS